MDMGWALPFVFFTRAMGYAFSVSLYCEFMPIDYEGHSPGHQVDTPPGILQALIVTISFEDLTENLYCAQLSKIKLIYFEKVVQV